MASRTNRSKRNRASIKKTAKKVVGAVKMKSAREIRNRNVGVADRLLANAESSSFTRATRGIRNKLTAEAKRKEASKRRRAAAAKRAKKIPLSRARRT